MSTDAKLYRAVIRFLRYATALALGCGVGYVLLNPLISIPLKQVAAAFRPLLIYIHSHLAYEEARILSIALVGYVSELANTIVISLGSGLCCYWLKSARPLLYATILWPLCVFLTMGFVEVLQGQMLGRVAPELTSPIRLVLLQISSVLLTYFLIVFTLLRILKFKQNG